MIVKRFNKIGRVSKPYYTQNNEQILENKLGRIRKRIEIEVDDTKLYDVYDMVSDQAKRIDILETIIKQIKPDCVLTPKMTEDEASISYYKIKNRMNIIDNILKEE